MNSSAGFKNNLSARLVILGVLIAASLPAQAMAEWYWITIPDDSAIGEFTELSALQYATTPIAKEQLHLIPNTLIEVWKKTDNTSTCSSERSSATEKMRTFDATHEFYKQMCFDSEIRGHQDCGPVVNPETIAARASLLKTMETSANSCLKKIEDEKQKEAEAEHLAKVEEAIENCDFNFFSNVMTDAERMRSYAEREACKEDIKPVTEVVAPKPIEITLPVEQKPIPYTVPIITPTSNPVVNSPSPAEPVEVSNVTPEATTTDETEEIDQLPMDDVTEIVSEAEQVENVSKEPSFFRKVTNFFKRLFSW